MMKNEAEKMNDILVRIRFLLPTLPRAEKAVAEYLLNEPETVRGATLALLSQECKSSDASVIRFCRRLGFDGFSSMKQSFLEALVDENDTFTEEVCAEDSMEEILRKVFLSNTRTLQDTLALVSDDYTRALEALLEAKSVHFFGVGDAFAVCELALMKFTRLGLMGSAHSDAMLQMVTASSLGEGDVAFGISYSGGSRTTVQAMKLAKEAGATTICITKMSKSPLLKYTDINLFTATDDITVGKDIVSRRVADQAIIDALYLGVLTKSRQDRTVYIRKTQKAIDNNKI